MKPVKFNVCNTTFAEDQPEYLPLPANVMKDGRVTTCWQMTFKEKIKVLFTGKIWLQQLTFNKPLQPQKVTVERPI